MRELYLFLGSCAASVVLAGCVSSPRFTPTKAEKQEPAMEIWSEEGMASYYAEEFNGRKTSNGETYDMNEMTAAHRTLPFNARVKVTNVVTGKSVIVRINDRGPFKDNRIIDLSLAAAKSIEVVGNGTAKVRLELVSGGVNGEKKP
jgi:rare lipoprotein A